MSGVAIAIGGRGGERSCRIENDVRCLDSSRMCGGRRGQPVVSGPSDSNVQVQREERSRRNGSRDTQRANRYGKRETEDRVVSSISNASIPQPLGWFALLLPCSRYPGELSLQVMGWLPPGKRRWRIGGSSAQLASVSQTPPPLRLEAKTCQGLMARSPFPVKPTGWRLL